MVSESVSSSHSFSTARLFLGVDWVYVLPSMFFAGNLLGICIDENTAVVVRGNLFEVIGKIYVIVYNGAFWSHDGSDL